MKLTPKQKESLDTYLTTPVKRGLFKKIKEKGITLSDRQIRNILNGESEDLHGILPLAIKEASFEKVRQANMKKVLKSL